MSEKIDIVIGVVRDYGWDDVAVWARSLVNSGFTGVGVVIVYGGGEATEIVVRNLRNLDMQVVRMPARGSVYEVRFEDISYVLCELLPELRFAIVTDIRDVYFQSDPSLWLESHLTKPILAVSEAIRYADEEWNRDNLNAALPAQAARLMSKTVCNAGVLAGEVTAVADLCLAISLVARSTPVYQGDQAAYNLLLDMEPYRSTVQVAVSEDGFACQAAALGSAWLRPISLEPPPTLDAEGVRTAGGKLYSIVHQYDRIPEWNALLRAKAYGVAPETPELREIAAAGRSGVEVASRSDSERAENAAPTPGAVSRLAEVLPDLPHMLEVTIRPRVSIICPTYRRASFLRRVVRDYLAQTFEGGLEMIILDDSPEPSDGLDAPWCQERGIRYHHIPGQRLTLGAKLNLMMQMARGEIIMEFDDDDHYAPQYVARMLEFLGDADFVTLSRWFCYDPGRKVFGYWSTDANSPVHFMLSPREPVEPVSTRSWDRAAVEGNLWGFGFSYVWRKSVYPEVEIPDAPTECFHTDLDFTRRLQRAGFKTVAVPDNEGIVLHIVHPDSSARIFPQYVMPEFMVRTFFPGYPVEPDRTAPHPADRAAARLNAGC
ncbi:glycosyltransferase family 2 protein [Nocardia vaccinii]|uniref:glycosyltransferase family 2 protein n=1 Tax=Nocardia vaccinii TaxID=1822 RepID=UPI00082E6F75|nr:glycosyltransferase [Nocardia vaccinii]